jgi:signal transduction histidine kinase
VEDLRAKTIEEILPSERLIEKIRDVTVHGIPQPGFMLEHGAQSLRISILHIRGWDDESERETLLIVADVTDMRSAPAPVRGSFSVENLPAAVWRANAGSLQFTAVGGAAERMLGYPASHWLKSPNFFGERIRAQDRDAVLALYRTAIHQSREVSAEFQCVGNSGEAFWCRETVRIAEPGVLAGVLVEIGQRRQIDQLRITAERSSALQSLSARLAHDLNNPLMIVSGYAEEMLHALGADDPRRGEIEQILAATERIGSLTAQLLQFTRKQASPAQGLELAPLLSGLADVTIEMRATKPVWVLADQPQLQEILLVLSDALKEERARVTIACDTAVIAEHSAAATLSPGTYARLILHAPGHGMEAEKRKVIFETFLQKDSAKRDGAALARAYAIVREWGGELGFESEPGAGSTFTMYLPVAEAGPRSRTAAKAAPESTLSAAEGLRETVLVVDDEAGIRALIVKILRRERYRLLEAGSASEGIAIARRHDGPIHLLLTDVMLPDRSGRDLAQQLREALPELKVVYISGFTDDESVRRGDFPPGARFLQKPFTLSALVGTVRDALDR